MTNRLSLGHGLELKPVSKSKRMALLIRPQTKEAIREIAKKKGTSMNDLINIIIEEYVHKEGY